MPAIKVPLGDEYVSAPAPDGWHVTVAERSHQPEPLPPAAPDSTLLEMARGAKSAVIAFTDATRACPDDLLIPPMVHMLEAAGVPREGITLLCATGMHRPSTNAEKVAKLGAEVAQTYRVLDHDPASVVSLGEFNGVPLTINPLCLETDLLLATGVVEPHQYAGWSGGGKTVAIGCAGADTIAETHGPRFLDDPGVRLGRIAGNSFQEIVRESARRTRVKYVSNVGLTENGAIIRHESGPPEQVHDGLADALLSLCEARVPAPFDIVVAGVGHPKDANLYQASRAATYIGLSQHALLKQGGVIILPATCPEGPGQGTGEQNFFEALAGAPDMDTLLNRLRHDGCRPGEQRAFMVAHMLRDHPIIVVGAEDPHMVRAAHMLYAATLDEALLLAVEVGTPNPTPDVLVVPHATQTLPVPL